MRTAILSLLLLGLTACRCGPDTPLPVTLRLKNTGADALYVDDSTQTLGMSVQRKVANSWLSFVEAPGCACQACDQVCKAPCPCAEAAPKVLKVAAGETLERSWSGVVQVSGTGACSGLLAGPACLKAENAPIEETFRLHLCYAPSVPGVVDSDGGSVPGSLSAEGTVCVDREFKPVDGVVEISPKRGAPCATSSDCTGENELCFGAACTTSCPANAYPPIGGTWQVRIQEPDDQGFFARATEGGQAIYTGTGTIGAVLYQNGTMALHLTRAGPMGGVLTAVVYLTLPQGYSVPLAPGPASIEVKVIDALAADNRALTVRTAAGVLLLAADSAQGAPLLAAGDLLPFAVASAEELVGCDFDSCGKKLFHATTFSAGAHSVELAPGKSATQTLAAGTYRFLAAGNYGYSTTSCAISTLRPYAIYLDRPQP